MTFQELKDSMPDATFFYFNIGEAILTELPHPAWWGQTAGIYYCGTQEPVDALVDKQMLP